LKVNNHFGIKCYSAGYSTEHTGYTVRLKNGGGKFLPSTRLYGGVVHKVVLRKTIAVTGKRDADSTEKGGEYNKYELFLIEMLWSSGT
jgi:hypothetical protein